MKEENKEIKEKEKIDEKTTNNLNLPNLKVSLMSVPGIITIVIVLAVAVGLFMKFSSFSFSGIFGIFKEQAIVIDKTANIVEKINRLAELSTSTYYEDNVIMKKKSTLFGKDELVIIAKGKVRVGFDLLKLDKQDIVIDSVSITVKLPKVKILDVITNPSDFETFEENGKWSHEEVTAYKNEARAIIETHAIENGILRLAEKSGREQFSMFLKALGFKKVNILLTN
jgi:hypothetical protein